MGTEALKSTSVTNLDTIPAIKNTSGEGGIGRVLQVNDYINVTAAGGVTSGSTYRFVRIPTTAKVKHVRYEGAAQTVGKYDFGLYYSDSTVDGTPAAYNNGTVLNLSLFGTDISFASAVVITDGTNESGNYTADKRNQPIWQAAGLTADPGGYFDIVATSTTTNTSGGLMGLEVEFVI